MEMEKATDDAASWTVASSSRGKDRKAQQEAARRLKVTQTLEKIKKRLQGTERNADTAPLLRLPGELRNKIYAYVLDGRFYIRGHELPRDTRNEVWGMQLFHTCRQIRHEIEQLPHDSVFCLQVDQQVGSLQKYVQLPKVPTVRLEEITILQLVTHEYLQWKATAGKPWLNSGAELGTEKSLRFISELPKLRHVEVIAWAGSHFETTAASDDEKRDARSSLERLLRVQRPDLHITFRTHIGRHPYSENLSAFGD